MHNHVACRMITRIYPYFICGIHATATHIILTQTQHTHNVRIAETAAVSTFSRNDERLERLLRLRRERRWRVSNHRDKRPSPAQLPSPKHSPNNQSSYIRWISALYRPSLCSPNLPNFGDGSSYRRRIGLAAHKLISQWRIVHPWSRSAPLSCTM